MALIRCLECEKEISDKADVCINCGCPINKKENFSNYNNIVNNFNSKDKPIQRKKKKSVAILYALLIMIVGLEFLIPNKNTNYTNNDLTIRTLQSIVVILFLLSPLIVLTENKFRDKSPIFKRRTVLSNIFGFSVLFVMTILITNTLASGYSDNIKNNSQESKNTMGLIEVVNNKEDEEQSTISTKEKNVLNEEIEYIKITSTELIDSFDENSVKCKKLYNEKNLEVTGTVSSVGEDILGDIYVCLGHETKFTFIGIQCYAKDSNTENKIAELKQGDIVTVRGIGNCGSLTFTIRKAVIE